MRLPALLLPLILAACVGGPVRSRPPPVEPASVLVVATFDSTGSGFAVAGRILTAWHVVEDSGGAAVVAGGGTARLVTFHRVEGMDLAEAPTPVPLPSSWLVYAVAEAHVGDRVDALGSQEGVPLHFGGEVSRVFAGETSALALPGRYLDVDCPVLRGMSGGPVLDARGDVVAVVTNRLDGHLVAVDIP